MMKDGKLVWHRDPEGSGWYTWSHHDEILYRAERVGLIWEVFATVAPVSLGLGSLREVKHLADQHHHRHIAEHGSENLRKYIERYPV